MAAPDSKDTCSLLQSSKSCACPSKFPHPINLAPASITHAPQKGVSCFQVTCAQPGSRLQNTSNRAYLQPAANSLGRPRKYIQWQQNFDSLFYVNFWNMSLPISPYVPLCVGQHLLVEGFLMGATFKVAYLGSNQLQKKWTIYNNPLCYLNIIKSLKW